MAIPALISVTAGACHKNRCICGTYRVHPLVLDDRNGSWTIREDFLHPEEMSLVVAQLGQSLDGRIATLTGESRYINGQAALAHLHRIRASVDAVVVGAGTVIADNPRLTVRLCEGKNPVRVIIDPRARVPHHLNCIADRSVRTIRIQSCDQPAPPGLEILRLPSQDGNISPRAIVDALAEIGLKRVLIEGGAGTISNFIDARAVDRLHVLVAPVIMGSGKPGLDLAPISQLCHALRPRTSVHVLCDGNVLFDCDLRCAQEEMVNDADNGFRNDGQNVLFPGDDRPPLADGHLRDHRHSSGDRHEQPS